MGERAIGQDRLQLHPTETAPSVESDQKPLEGFDQDQFSGLRFGQVGEGALPNGKFSRPAGR